MKNLPFLVMFSLCSIFVVSVSAQRIESARFSKDSLLFDIVILNDTDNPLILEEIGLDFTFTAHRTGRKSREDPITLKSQAAYEMALNVEDEEGTRMKAADPALPIASGEKVRFTLGSSPSFQLVKYRFIRLRQNGRLYFSNGKQLATTSVEFDVLPESNSRFRRP